MCFHTSIIEKVDEIEKQTGTRLVNEEQRSKFDEPQYHLNGFAHPPMLIITQERNDLLIPAYWGIVPKGQDPDQLDRYYKKAVKFGGGLNARDDKLFDHFIYRHSMLSKKCLIPVNGFFEPHTHEKKKYPFYIKNAKGQLLMLGGIYTRIDDQVTFSIITKKASPLLEKVHNVKKRQPLLVENDKWNDWLVSNERSDVENLINSRFDDDQLATYPVKKALFSPKEDSNVSSILEKVDYPELELLN